jgi:hypothetical protein
MWRDAIVEKGGDWVGAFDGFASGVVRELQHARYDVGIEDLVPGVGELVRIGLDVVYFSTSGDVLTLVSLTSTGILARREW